MRERELYLTNESARLLRILYLRMTKHYETAVAIRANRVKKVGSGSRIFQERLITVTVINKSTPRTLHMGHNVEHLGIMTFKNIHQYL